MVRKPRIEPRPPADWDAEVLDALAVMRQGDSQAAQRNEPGAPRVVNALGLLMRYPALAKAFLTFNRHLLFNSSLSDRIRELLILRIAWLRRAEYEWAQHVLLAQKAGLRKEEIEAVKDGPHSAVWAPLDAALLAAVDELHTDAFVTDTTWDALAGGLDQRQLMDLVFTVGAYDLLAMAFNTFGLELDPGLEGFGKPNSA
ncbi:MAG: carboxymuconolactone decarboxylase family protein [Candidatus Binataceae bacterium]